MLGKFKEQYFSGSRKSLSLESRKSKCFFRGKEKKRTEYRKRLTAIYKKHMPEKLKKVDALVEKYTAWGVPDNRLHETYEKVCKKYKQTPQSAYDGRNVLH